MLPVCAIGWKPAFKLKLALMPTGVAIPPPSDASILKLAEAVDTPALLTTLAGITKFALDAANVVSGTIDASSASSIAAV